MRKFIKLDFLKLNLNYLLPFIIIFIFSHINKQIITNAIEMKRVIKICIDFSDRKKSNFFIHFLIC